MFSLMSEFDGAISENFHHWIELKCLLCGCLYIRQQSVCVRVRAHIYLDFLKHVSLQLHDHFKSIQHHICASANKVVPGLFLII